MRITFLSTLLLLSSASLVGCSSDDDNPGGVDTDTGVDETGDTGGSIDSDVDSGAVDSTIDETGDMDAGTDSSTMMEAGGDSTTTEVGGDSTTTEAGGDSTTTETGGDSATTEAAVDSGATDSGTVPDLGLDVAVDAPIPTKKVFVTSTTYDGDLGGIAGANSKCAARATAAGLTGTFKAWLSDGTSSPSTSFTHPTADYVLVDGTVVAHGWIDLTDGTLLHAIDKNETGGAATSTAPICSTPTETTSVWSGTKSDGTAAGTANCNDWTSNATTFEASWGWPGGTNSYWSLACAATASACVRVAGLYCIEQ